MDISQKILSEITVFNKYARFIPEISRRETWEELCQRNMSMHVRKYPALKDEIQKVYRDYVIPKKVLPSMRSLQFGGNSIELSNNRIYNCAYLPIDHPDAFSETMFLLLGGCFKAGTMVKTKNGDKPIEEITIEDEVLTFNKDNNNFSWVNPIFAGLTPTASKPKVKLTTSTGEEIICTADHKFLTSNKGWIEAKDLTNEDKIISKMNSQFISKVEAYDDPINYYDLGIEQTHNFCLSNGMVVHNTGVGYGVQVHQVEKLPVVVGPKSKTRRFLIGDSIEGWADAIKILVESYFHNKLEPIFDYRDIRPKGARLITSGGKAPGSAPLRICIEQIRAILANTVGRKLIPLEAHDIQCHIADAVLSGGIRRAAMIALFSKTDMDMLSCKSGQWWELNPQRGRANNSIVLERNNITDEEFFDIWERVEESGAGEPGIFWTNDTEIGTNPCCVVGSTKIATANGSSGITMKALVDEGKDVDVYTVDSEGKLAIRKMECPRLIKSNVDIYRVKFSDDTYIDVDSSHKFILMDGSERGPLDLIKGDALTAMTEFQSQLWSNKNSQHYKFLNFQGKAKSEHRFIVEHNIGRSLQADEVVHHKNFNGLDNSIDNLQLMTKIDHDHLHRDRMLGSKNVVRIIKQFDPLIKIVENSTGIEQELQEKQSLTSHEVFFDKDSNEFKVKKQCEFTGIEMTVSWYKRHTSYSSKSAMMSHKWKLEHDRMQLALLTTHNSRKDKIKLKQAKIYNDLVVEISSPVTKHSWAAACHEAGISSEISRKTSPFRSYQNLKEYAATINHRVISVECIGKDDVYTGTVAETHTFFAIGEASVDKAGKIKRSYVLNRNCEISLNPFQFCNVSEINASDVESQEDLNARARVASFLGTLQASYTDFHYLRSEWEETTKHEALIGVGMTGIGSGAVLKLDLKEAAEVVKTENLRVAELIGVNPAARTATIKPSGTTSCVVGSSSGIHAWHNDYYVRRMRVGKNEALYHYMKNNFPALVEDCFHKPHIEAVMSFPQKAPEGSILRTESFMDLLERVKKFNVDWVHAGHREGKNFHNVSCTISLKPKEWGKCGRWMWKNREFYTGISVLPYDAGTYVQPPFEDITKERYEELMSILQHDFDLSKIVEADDHTTLKEEIACSGGGCEIP